jgi:hypothetical protein
MTPAFAIVGGAGGGAPGSCNPDAGDHGDAGVEAVPVVGTTRRPLDAACRPGQGTPRRRGDGSKVDRFEVSGVGRG